MDQSNVEPRLYWFFFTRWMRKESNQAKIFGYLLITPALLFVIAILGYPTVFNFFISLREWSWYSSISSYKPFIGLENYQALLSTPRFWNSIKVSLLLLIIGLTVEYVLGLALALLINLRFHGRKLFRTIIILPIMMAPIVNGLQWHYLLSANYSVINYTLSLLGFNPPSWLSEPRLGLFVIVLVDTWTYVPFVALIFLAALQQIQKDLYEAAEVDGASALAKFRYITLPFLVPSTVMVLLLRGTEIFRTFDVVYILTGGGPGRATEVLGMLLYRTAFTEGNIGVAGALAVIIALLGMILSTVLVNIIRSEVKLFG